MTVPKKTGRKPFPTALKRVRIVCFVKPRTLAYFEAQASEINPATKIAAEVLDFMAEGENVTP